MPASYAHYRFGKTVLPTLPADVQRSIHRFRRLYDVGLQGPDFFFYYNPLMSTAIGSLGGSYHQKTGTELFTSSAARLKHEAAAAYLYGLLGHYCLDSACHPFVNRVVEEGKCSHVALESEFDRYLMASDGIAEPHRKDMTPHLKLTRGECVTVADFYPPAKPGHVLRSVRHMRWCLKFLARKDRAGTRKLLNAVNPKLCDSLIPEEPVAGYERMDSELLARFNRAARHYPELLGQLTALLEKGDALGEDFTPTFDPREGESSR